MLIDHLTPDHTPPPGVIKLKSPRRNCDDFQKYLDQAIHRAGPQAAAAVPAGAVALAVAKSVEDGRDRDARGKAVAKQPSASYNYPVGG